MLEREGGQITSERYRSDAIRVLIERDLAEVGFFYVPTRVFGETYLGTFLVSGLERDTVSRLTQGGGKRPPPGIYRSLDGPTLPSRHEFEHFQESAFTFRPEVFRESPFFQHYFAPIGLHDQCRLLIGEPGRITGWIGLLRRSGEPAFKRLDAQMLDATLPEVKTLLASAAALEAVEGDTGAVQMTLDPQGELLGHSPSATAWLRIDWVLPAVRMAVRVAESRHPTEAEAVMRAGGLAARIVRHHQVRGGHTYVITVEPEAQNEPGLSAREREVAAAMASGYSTHESATKLGISANTVKFHRKKLFEKLGVGNAAEATRRIVQLGIVGQ